MKKSKLYVFLILFLLVLNFTSAARLPEIGGDNSTWGVILNNYLVTIAGNTASSLNQTMVNGTNIYDSSINTTHIIDGTLTSDDLGDDSVKDDQIDYSSVTIADFTNDANYLDKDEGGIVNGNLIINGNFSLIGSYLNATVTNQYLNGSFFPEITNIFDIGSSIFKWANIYVSNIYSSKVYSEDWTNVTITESQISNLQSYLTSESDPVFSAWNKNYGDLINTPTIPTLWDEVFNNTKDIMTGDLNMSSKNITTIDCIIFASGGKICNSP